ncbi:hypothetical protein [Quatrionicoccus australiensis]|uniref:hypothetical protein n=1 Tax=Quatrionicoccus australiensis TaxID=138118 RepID=UPI001CF87A14|nr:hypothetical protein [Quatrionicoccus australiensis]UCV16436.1 hypothetical protein KI612_06995 [Quatrionicoccus australiensis]
MIAAHVERWVAANPLAPIEVDCATAVMLKILDGKCKMAADEKIVMAHLYDAVRHLPGGSLGEDSHALIGRARGQDDEALKNFIYEQRVLAETVIGRLVMKAFKAMIRQRGLLAIDVPVEDDA